jgi:hypothetical protein
MNRIHCCHHFRRTAAVLGAFAASVLVVLTGATAAFAYDLPPSGGGGATTSATLPPLPPGLTKHPPLPAQAHVAVIGGMPGWQIALIAIGAAIFAAALAVTLDRVRTAHRQLPAPDA